LAFTSRSRTDAAAKDAAKLKEGVIPQHIAIIMDGNGRWAKRKGMPRVFGHREGVRSVREIVEVCGELGVRYLTLYAFSTENWKRPKDEVSTLMGLLVSSLRQELKNLHKSNVRLTTIGDLSKLPREAQGELAEAVETTRDNTGLTLNLALSYSGRWDLVRAMQAVAREVSAGTLGADEISEEVIAAHLSTAGIPDPDLLIRTSGEMRISNFLLWELAYTEIHISECFWPDFRRAELYRAIAEYQRRERRFGLVSEQLADGACTGDGCADAAPDANPKQSINQEHVNALESL
jgi:undecaprenyl diphosphate synthase